MWWNVPAAQSSGDIRRSFPRVRLQGCVTYNQHLCMCTIGRIFYSTSADATAHFNLHHPTYPQLPAHRPSPWEPCSGPREPVPMGMRCVSTSASRASRRRAMKSVHGNPGVTSEGPVAMETLVWDVRGSFHSNLAPHTALILRDPRAVWRKKTLPISLHPFKTISPFHTQRVQNETNKNVFINWKTANTLQIYTFYFNSTRRVQVNIVSCFD